MINLTNTIDATLAFENDTTTLDEYTLEGMDFTTLEDVEYYTTDEDADEYVEDEDLFDILERQRF